jgi:hypothetical protein
MAQAETAFTEAERAAISLICGFCFQAPEAHGDSDAGPMTVCPRDDTYPLDELPPWINKARWECWRAGEGGS